MQKGITVTDINKYLSGGNEMSSDVRPENMERITTEALAEAFIAEKVKELREQIGSRNVLLALSGGVD